MKKKELFFRLLDRMEDLQAMLARYKAEGASSETLEEVARGILPLLCTFIQRY